MAATGNEVPLLSQLKLLKDWVVNQLAMKMNEPDDIATDGYIIMAQTPGTGSGPTIWIDPTIGLPVATSTSNGLLSNADKAKLDALPSSFTEPAVDIVRTTTHSTSYTKDTLEIVTDSTGKVTEMWFVTAD